MKTSITALVRKALEDNGQITLNELRALFYQINTDAQLLRAGRYKSTLAAKKYNESKPLSENDISSLRRSGVNHLVCAYIYQKTKVDKKPWLEIDGNVVRLKANTAEERNLGP
jgi:hypothetical protein